MVRHVIVLISTFILSISILGCSQVEQPTSDKQVQTQNTQIEQSEQDEHVQSKITPEQYVDNTINELIESEEFKTGDIEIRKKLSEDLMNELEKLKYINNVYYEDNMYTFQYSNGSLGGIMLKDWNPMLN